MLNNFILVIVILLLVTNSSYSACVSLTQTPNFDIACANVVDYPYKDNGTPPAQLNALAIVQLNLYNVALPTTCGLNYKKVVCGMIYPRCESDAPVRVCKSLCDTTFTSCLFGIPNDNTGLDCSNPGKFDQTNSSTCNTMTTVSTTTVGSSREEYIPGGICDGIVGTHVYIPTSEVVNNATGSNLSPMLPKFVIQTAIEGQLRAGIESLPVWLGKECHFATKKYLCSSKFMEPHTTSIRATLTPVEVSVITNSFPKLIGLIDNPIYIPSFHHQDVCLDYKEKCGEFIALANNPSLNPIADCATFASYNPIASQPVKVTTYPGFAPLDPFAPGISTNQRLFFSPASRSTLALDIASEKYETLCPNGFELPENPSDFDNRFFPGSSDCALSCRYFNIIYIIYIIFILFVYVDPQCGLLMSGHNMIYM